MEDESTMATSDTMVTSDTIATSNTIATGDVVADDTMATNDTMAMGDNMVTNDVMVTSDVMVTNDDMVTSDTMEANGEAMVMSDSMLSTDGTTVTSEESTATNKDSMATNVSMVTSDSPVDTVGEEQVSCGSIEEDGPPSALGHAAYGDAKKRPLSVSSTSSSTSSTSSLPRQQRKKVAAMPTALASNCMWANDMPVSKTASPIPPYMAVMADLHLDTLTDEEQSQHSPESDKFNYCQREFVSKSENEPSSVEQSPQHRLCLDDLDLNHQGRRSPVSVEESPQRRQNLDTNCSELTYIAKVVAEILDTERTYVKDLHEVIQVNIFFRKKLSLNKINK